MMKPFVHKFETAANKYIYDVNSNRVVRVSEAAYDIIDDFQEDQSEILLKKRGGHNKKQLKQCVGEISRARKERGLFLPDRPKRMTFDGSPLIKDLIASSPSQQLILNVTEQCNLRCTYCAYSGRYHNRRTHSSRSMDFQTAKKAIDNLLKRPQKEMHISFYGGEPLLKLNLIKQLVAYTESLTSNKIFWNMTTNGTLLCPEVSDYLRGKGFLLMVSVDGPREVHDRYRVDSGGRGSLDKILANLSYIQSVDRDYYNENVSFSVVSAPPYSLRAVSDFFSSEPLVYENHVSFSYVDHTYEYFEFSPSEQDMAIQKLDDRELEELYFTQIREDKQQDALLKGRFEKDLIAFYQRPKIPLGEEIRLNGCCVPGVRRLFVTVDGILHVCERMDCDYAIGTVDKWIDPNLVERLVKDYVEFSSDCFDCWACRLCSRCFAAFSTTGGKFDPASRAGECNSTRNQLHGLLGHYYEVIEHDPSRLDFLAEAALE
jgi:uncharacterized protein